MTKDIKLVIFDLDGTLVDAYPAIISSLNFTLQKLKLPPEDSLVIRRAVGRGDESLLEPFVGLKDLNRALRIYRRHHRQALLRGSKVFPKVFQLLTYLKNKGYKLAVASNRPTKFSRILIRHLGLSKYFDYVLCADTLKNRKPHPEILNKIMRRFSLKPAQTLYIGDMAIDAQAGRRARVKSIIVTGGSSTRSEIRAQTPYRIISNISGLFRLL